MIGARQTIALAQFKPALAMNPEITDRYQANRLRVVRQVRYSTASEHCIDLVLFLNGIPVATAELKTDFTQSVGDAVDQYRYDRHPRAKGSGAEPLLTLAKVDGVSNRRLAFDRLRDKAVVGKLFVELGPRYRSRPGGYLRILKCGFRAGDNAPMAYVELVDRPQKTAAVAADA